MDKADLDNRFNYHRPGKQHAWYCRALASVLNDTLPEGREKSLAMTKLEEVMFWSNASIARQSE